MMKGPKPHHALAALLLLGSIVFWVFAFAFQKQHAHEHAHSVLKSALPLVASNLDKVVVKLNRETTAESVAKLSDLSDLLGILPGLSSSAITPENSDQVAIRAILSNRRFLKSFAELQKLDKAAASKIVRTNLSSALDKYLREYDASLRRFAPHYKIANQFKLTDIANPFNIRDTANQSPGGIAFVLASPNEPGKEMMPGLRLKVLSLVWMSGLLNLRDNKDQVEQVARVAINQRKELNDDATLTPFFKLIMRQEVSLYNRRILSSGLIGVTFDGRGLETNAMSAAGIHWQQSTETTYQAALTKYDLPVQFGAMGPDYSSGRLTISIVSQMGDTNFDILLKEIAFMP